jgi:hypothetical protein
VIEGVCTATQRPSFLVCIRVEIYSQFRLRGSVYDEAFPDRVKHWIRAICQKNSALPSCLGGPDKHECEKSRRNFRRLFYCRDEPSATRIMLLNLGKADVR